MRYLRHFSFISRLIVMASAVVLPLIAYSQSPTQLPRREPEPAGFFDSTENFIFYVVLPIVITILYFVWKRNTAKLKKEEEKGI